MRESDTPASRLRYAAVDRSVKGTHLAVLDGACAFAVELTQANVAARGRSAVGLDRHGDETESEITFPTGTWRHVGLLSLLELLTNRSPPDLFPRTSRAAPTTLLIEIMRRLSLRSERERGTAATKRSAPHQNRCSDSWLGSQEELPGPGSSSLQPFSCGGSSLARR